MIARRTRLGLSMAALVPLLATCADSHDGWTPVLEETSTVFLQSNTERAIAGIRAARDRLESDPAAAASALGEAEATLVQLSSYYLPLMRAREVAPGRASEDARQSLEQLARKLDMAVLKGELILP